MDIQVSSNFERLLFEMNGSRRRAHGRAARAVPLRPAGWRSSRPARGLDRRCVPGARCRRRGHDRRISRTYAETGMLIDPHTAVGIGAVAQLRGRPRPAGRWSRSPPPTRRSSPTRSSGRPGVRPGLPPHLADLFDRPERTHRAAERPRHAVQRFVATTFAPPDTVGSHRRVNASNAGERRCVAARGHVLATVQLVRVPEPLRLRLAHTGARADDPTGRSLVRWWGRRCSSRPDGWTQAEPTAAPVRKQVAAWPRKLSNSRCWSRRTRTSCSPSHRRSASRPTRERRRRR
jgi:hypothetical protein